MKVSQVCAYANWPNESIEVWKWCSRNRPIKDIVKEMESLFLMVYSKVFFDKDIEDLARASRTIGMTDLSMEVPNNTLKDILQTASYTRYKGRCLEEDRLQYFAPHKILAQGKITVEKNKILVTPLNDQHKKELDNNVEPLLLLRQFLGDDPKRIESDRLRAMLGKEWNYLFEWKRNL